MLEPDVTLTDLLLALQCAVFSFILFRRPNANPPLVRLFAWLFASVSLSSLSGATWHGVFSASDTAAGHFVWFLTMAMLAVATATLWLISGQLSASDKWSAIARVIASVQLLFQLSVSAAVTDSFAVAAVGILPAAAAVIVLCVVLTRKTGAMGAIYCGLGFTLAAAAGLVVVFDLSLHPTWASTHAVYHMVQFAAFWLVFWSVPALALTVKELRNGIA